MNRLRSLFPVSVVPIALALLGSYQTAQAQTVTITPVTITDPNTPLAFNNVPFGATSKPQNIGVASPVSTTILLQASAPWIFFPSGPIYHPGPTGVTIPVAVSAAGLTPGSYSASFTISINQQVVATVYVSATVTTFPVLSAYPTDLFFSAQQGAYAATPGSALVTIISSGPALSYTIQTQVQPGDPNWILLSANAGTSGYTGVTVQANPYGLSAGIHSGSILVLSTTSNDAVAIDVTLTIYPNSLLSITPTAPPPILWQVGTNAPPAQQFTVSATDGPVQFTARLSPLVSWATVSPLSNTAGPFTPATLTLIPAPNLVGLQPGTYTTNLIVTPIGGPDLPPVPITLIATTYSYLRLSPTSLSYSAQFESGQSPPDQQVTVTAQGGTAVGFTVSSDSAWLRATPSSSTTPAVLTVHVNPSGLPVGTFSGHLTIYPTNGDAYAETVSVTLMVVSSAQLTAGPSQLLFSYQAGFLAPAPQQVKVRSSGQAVSFTVSTVTASCGGNWLTAVPSSYTTPATLTVSVFPTTFPPGVCQGIVTLNYNSGSGPASALVRVTLALSNNPELTISMPPGFGDEHVPQGAAPYTQPVALSSTDAATPVDFSAFVSNLSGGPWLGIAGFTTGLTPQVLSVRINPSAVPGPGTYTGNLVISSSGLPNGLITIPMTLTVTSTVSVSVSPTSLSFSQTQGGTTPAAKTLTLTSSGGGVATFVATIPQISGSNWLRVSPSSGQANGNLVVSVLSNSLAQGDYPAQILLTFQNSITASLTVNVTLHVGPPLKTVSVSPQSLSFAYQMGAAQPASQKISVTSTGGAVDFTVGVTSSGWLSTDVTSGTTPKDVNVSVNTQGLTVGGSPYIGSITINAPGVLADPITINVKLTVAAASTPTPMTISNNASGAFGGIAPGELITIKGMGLGPTTPVTFSVNAQGNVDSTLAGVRVLFSGIPGTPLYVSPGQINVIAPYEIEGLTSANIMVEHQGMQSAPIPVAVAADAPGLYTNNMTGAGQVVAINQNGTLNGPPGGGFSPAPQGSVMVVYATGFGQTSPHSITGSVTPIPHSASDFLRVEGPVTATIGGKVADVEFAGAAPGLVTGVIQLNIKVPEGVSGNQLPISVSVNGKPTPLTGTTVAVQ